ncbi:uncharacterized protein LOC110107492 isoform X1 [Dendrobium catenatum]|uniref:uncharacterized protein LOC110107492 isoform X1 n=1 Tax=Dendrobium catenatum TaxID=906689 RepID=UPI0010A063DC|nr:uncharacterized protein LOC110107492 isoform X1 [Dendrobium catenatum]
MEEESSANSSPNLRNPSRCDECGSNPWKYRCPGCSIRSCSLPCVNSHKKRTSCTGKRRLTEHVPLSQFDDNLLLADYRFLEETKRVAESARRMISGFRCYFGFKLPTKLFMLRNAARRRQIQLLFFPAGMSKRETNQSRYDQRFNFFSFLRRKNTIFWTLELRFHDTGVVLVHHSVDEHANLLSIFVKHLTPGPWNHKLRSFCEAQLDDLKLFLQINPKNSKSTFRKLDIEAPIGSQLAKIVVLEHPIIFVYLPSHENGFEVEASRMPLLRNPPPSTFDGIPSHNGTLYRVEEVEEGEMPSDTRITDLVDCRKSEANCNVPSNTFIAKEIAKEDKQITEANTGVVKDQISGEAQGEQATNSPESGEAVFYFEKELRDAYSDLIGEMNPDDFLCLDGVYEDSVDLREGRWYDIEERRRGDAEELRDPELDELRDAFEGRKGDGLGEKEENDDLKVRRNGDLEEKRVDSFLSGGFSFGEMELEEGEIPCFSQ